MNRIRVFLGVVTLAALSAGLSGPSAARPAPENKVTVEKVKYDDLGKLIRSYKGKVVVVDFWADFCVPCKREFPHLVELHNKYAKDGFVAVSVSLDDPADAKTRQKVEDFLVKQKAFFKNLQLDEPYEVWKDKLQIDGPPLVYVFNRDNRIVKRLAGDEVDYALIARTVEELLK